MGQELYTIVAMAARYWFCVLMVIIAFRAWRITVVDNRRAALLRAWSPQTGCIGEFVINPGKTKKQVSVPVPREGVLGSSKRADVYVPGKDLERFHATLEQREGGLLVAPRGKAKLTLNGSIEGPQLYMRDGDTLTIGKTKLLLVVFDPEPGAREQDAFTDDALWGDSYADTRRRASKERGLTPKKRRPEDDIKDFEDDLWPDQ